MQLKGTCYGNERKCYLDEKLSTYLYIKNANQAKYGNLLKGLNSQKSLKNDQYPKNLVDGINALSNHSWDN